MGRILHRPSNKTDHARERHSIIAALFGVFSRKRSAEKFKNQHNNDVSPSDPFVKTNGGNFSQDDCLNQSLPKPPGSGHPISRSLSMTPARGNSGGGKKLISNLSMKMPFKTRSEDTLLSKIDNKDKKMQREDSLWKKPIILGDKCKVPDVDEDDDTVVCDEKGKVISAYHKRTSGSRQSSSIDPEAVQGAISKT